MAFSEGSKIEWLKNKLIASIMIEYSTSKDLLNFINKTMPLGVRKDMISMLDDEEDSHSDAEENFAELKAEIDSE